VRAFNEMSIKDSTKVSEKYGKSMKPFVNEYMCRPLSKEIPNKEPAYFTKVPKTS